MLRARDQPVRASREAVSRALAARHDVIVWPGGEQNSMRNRRERDQAVLAGRHGFVRQAIRSGVPIVSVAMVGGRHLFVLSEGRFLARWSVAGQALAGRDFADHALRAVRDRA